jgi:hypothetical protein
MSSMISAREASITCRMSRTGAIRAASMATPHVATVTVTLSTSCRDSAAGGLSGRDRATMPPSRASVVTVTRGPAGASGSPYDSVTDVHFPLNDEYSVTLAGPSAGADSP